MNPLRPKAGGVFIHPPDPFGDVMTASELLRQEEIRKAIAASLGDELKKITLAAFITGRASGETEGKGNEGDNSLISP